MTTQPKLLTDILNHLAQSKEARERFNSLINLKVIDPINSVNPYFDLLFRSEFKVVKPEDFASLRVRDNTILDYPFDFVGNDFRKLIIQTALSNTPDGQAVCGFLGENLIGLGINYEEQQLQELDKSDSIFGKSSTNSKLILANIHIHRLTVKKTLNQSLHQTFTNALFNGKDFETALEETNAIYLENLN